MNQIDEQLLESIADLHGTPAGAYNIRKNGAGVARQSSANIEIIPKQDKPGIDIIVKPHTKNESVHIPVIVTDTGINDMVYNHFEIGEGADILIVAGCGIHNDGSAKSEHDGIHTFHIGKNARVRYVEKHYGEGDGSGERVLNPTTEVELEEGAYCEMEMVQIKGVDSTIRETTARVRKLCPAPLQRMPLSKCFTRAPWAMRIAAHTSSAILSLWIRPKFAQSRRLPPTTPMRR